MDKHPIERAAAVVGSQVALATLLGVTKAAVHQWKDDGRRVPARHCLAIERATSGAVTRAELRPDDYWLIWPDLEVPAAQAANTASNDTEARDAA